MSFVNELLLFCGLGGGVHRARGLSALPEPVAADPLAALDDASSISTTGSTGGNHYRMQLLGDEADNPDQRIAEDINLFIDRALSLGIGLLSAVVTLVSFVVILWTLSAAAPLQLFGVTYAIPGYLVWVALDLRGRRNRADASDRLAADRAQLPPAALRGRFPLQPGAGARERRADRAARRRGGRARAPARPLRPDRQQLDARS